MPEQRACRDAFFPGPHAVKNRRIPDAGEGSPPMARAATRPSIDFLWHMTRQDFADRYVGNFLGAVWTLLLPLSQVLIFTVVFGTIIGARLPGEANSYGYSVYLISGLLPWTAFASTVQRGMTAFLDKKSILSKIYLPLPMVTVPVAFSEALTLVIGLCLLSAYILLNGGTLGAWWLLPAVLVLQQAFALGLALFLGTLLVFIRDVRELMGLVLQLWFWATPIVYLPSILPDWATVLVDWNPALLFIGPYHAIFQNGPAPYAAIAGLGVAAVLSLALGLFMVRAMERHIRDVI